MKSTVGHYKKFWHDVKSATGPVVAKVHSLPWPCSKLALIK